MQPPQVSLIIETYNLVEGTDHDRFANALRSATVAAQRCDGELLVTDVCGGPEVARLVMEAAPEARLLNAVGMCYDEAKMLAAAEARGESLVYLDSDCEPLGRWPDELLDAMRSQPAAPGVGGFTRYRGGGVLAAVMSVMDFGFLLPRCERPLACYAFNNAAFRRRALVACPIKGDGLRCGCFAHAQRLLRQGTPLMLAPDAVAIHDLPPIVRERSRQGHDTIAACWANPALPEARWLRWGMLSVPVFMAFRIILDWRRLLVGFRDLDLGIPGLIAAVPLVPVLRLIDGIGMAHAFWVGRRGVPWGGWPE